jgi:hypothetical protein
MGYSTGEARSLVKAREQGGAAAQNDTLAGISASHGDTASSRRRAGGTGDGIGDGPGARGTARRGSGSAALMGADAGLAGYANEGARFGLHVSSGARPGAITSSGNTSLHASGHAIDEAGPADGMLRYARYMATRYGAGLDELIHTRLGFGIKNGRRVPLSFWGPTINADHVDHVHVGDRTPSGASGGATGSLAGGAAASTAGGGRRVGLHAGRSGLRGVPGALADRAASMYAAGLEKRINANLGAGGGGGGGLEGLGSVTGSGGSPDANRALARRMMLAYGGGKWGPAQWPPLNSLWTRESGFDQNARNPTSGAQGIPQALGHGDIGSSPRQQIAWGLRYVDQRFHSPAAAWAHETSVGWYGRGGSGTARKPTMIGIGDHPTRAEDFTVTPRHLGPPSSRAGGHGGARGLATVTIQNMTVNWAREGDLKDEMKREFRQALEEIAVELDEGVSADEDALLR